MLKILSGINPLQISGKKMRGDYPNHTLVSFKNKKSQSILLIKHLEIVFEISNQSLLIEKLYHTFIHPFIQSSNRNSKMGIVIYLSAKVNSVVLSSPSLTYSIATISPGWCSLSKLE